MPAGDPLLTRLAGRLDAVSRTIVDEMVEQLAGYRALPEEQRRGLLDDVQFAMARAMQHAASGEPYTQEDLKIFRSWGERRGAEAFPFADFMAAYDVAVVVALREFWPIASMRDYRELMQLTDWAAREVPRAAEASASGYAAARRKQGDTDSERQQLIKKLLRGRPSTAAAATAGITLPESYLVLLCRTPHPSRLDTGSSTVFRHSVDAMPGVLSQGDPLSDGLLILLPVEGEVAAARAVVADLVASMAERSGRPIHAAQAWRPELTAIPDAVTEASQVLAMVAAIPDATSRPYQADELLVELAIAGQPAVANRLADFLTRLDSGNDLRRTLEVFFRHGLDREHSAKALNIHRRTLTYRLKRIHDLSGVDPTSAHGIQLLRAALTASRMPRS